MRRANVELNRRLDEKFGFEGVIGSSPQMNAVIDRLKRIAPTDASVLIQGETGTGKELVAQAIHQNSPRKNKPFVALNCAALSENILESELFGHVRGAFTDASTDRIGKFEYAHGGTLFLDEVGDMPLATQIKLLRVLENGEITRVGSNDPVRVNVRILSATNRNLEDPIAAGTFPQRSVSPAEGGHDLAAAAGRAEPGHSAVDRALSSGSLPGGITRRSRACRPPPGCKLMAFDWPGNVRQLRNVIESMVVVDYDGVLDLDDLPTELAGPALVAVEASTGSISSLVGKPLVEVEKLFIAETLKFAGGNREHAAEMLGIGERTLYRKIKEYGL